MCIKAITTGITTISWAKTPFKHHGKKDLGVIITAVSKSVQEGIFYARHEQQSHQIQDQRGSATVMQVPN